MKIDLSKIPADVPAIHVLLLALIAQAHEQTLEFNDICEALQCDAPRASSMIRHLMREGYLMNAPKSDHYGRPHVSLTIEGNRFLDGIEVE